MSICIQCKDWTDNPEKCQYNGVDDDHLFNDCNKQTFCNDCIDTCNICNKRICRIDHYEPSTNLILCSRCVSHLYYKQYLKNKIPLIQELIEIITKYYM